MKKLIDEIEGHKFSYAYDDFRKGYNGGLNVAIEVLNQYNIITAPKSIKLSEIVSRLNEHYNTKIIINRKPTSYYNCYIVCRKSLAENEDYELLIRDNKIDDIDEFCCYQNYDNTKWLYTLWIAGTIIEDDMKEKE